MSTKIISYDSPSSASGPRESLRPILWLSLIFAALKITLHIVTNVVAQRAGYGIFRDELYYLMCGRNLAFGYVDQPPLAALQARVTDVLFGYQHMWSLRLIPAIAGGAKVFLTGMLVWALSGGRRAAALAMLGVIVAGVYLGIDSYLSMNCFDPVFWMTCTLALIRIVQAESPASVRNWWIVLGISAGLAMENKDSVVFFLVSALVAVLLSRQRRILYSRWFAVSVLLMALVALPNLLWQIHYHFPTLEWLRDVSKSDKDVKLPPLKFLLAQIVTLQPLTVLLWAPGILWLLLGKTARPYRFLGYMYVIFLPLMMVLKAKDYYLAPIYPVYFAAGAVARFAWAGNIRWRNALTGIYAALLAVSFFFTVQFSIPILPPDKFVAYEHKLGFAPKDSENHDPTILPQFYADRFGWTEMVAQVNAIYHSLPPQEQAVTGILASNYGQASAINILGKKDGLPTAISGHQNYWMWGPRGYTGQEMIVINEDNLADMNKVYASCKVAAVRDNPLAMPWERGPIYLCYGRKTTYAADWKEFKHYY
jgi:Dolichyl-phosphate-mannose-protein mannosyltransferase